MSTQHRKIQPRLTIVGTGPGDAGLITIKGAQALIAADVVIYDNDVNAELLKYVPGSVKRIRLGKYDNGKHYTQEHLNALVVDLAFSYGHVVSLKRTSFIPGHEHNEISYAEIFNIETEIIPGIGLYPLPYEYGAANFLLN